MSTDPYAFCPCGSGKKVKWCCAPFLTQVNRAFELLQEGQQESAHKLFQELLQQHNNIAALWLYYAEFLTHSGQWDQADAALDQALQRDPKLGMAFYVRGQLRQQEGEIQGALMLYHKAAELVAPEAKDQLLDIYVKIADLSHQCCQFLATIYALDRALQLRPDLPELHRYRDDLLRKATSPGDSATLAKDTSNWCNRLPTIRRLGSISASSTPGRGKTSVPWRPCTARWMPKLTTVWPNKPAP